MLCQITFRSRPLYNSVQDWSDSSYHYKLFLKSFNLVKMDVALENFFSLHKIQPLPTVVKKKQDTSVVSSLGSLAVSAVVTHLGLLASAPPGNVRVMARHFTGKEIQNNGDTSCFIHRTIADQLCIARSTHLECEACHEKNDIYVLSHYVAAREKRRFDLRNYRPPPPSPEDVLFFVRFFIQNKIQKVWHVILTIKPHIYQSINV